MCSTQKFSKSQLATQFTIQRDNTTDSMRDILKGLLWKTPRNMFYAEILKKIPATQFTIQREYTTDSVKNIVKGLLWKTLRNMFYAKILKKSFRRSNLLYNVNTQLTCVTHS